MNVLIPKDLVIEIFESVSNEDLSSDNTIEQFCLNMVSYFIKNKSILTADLFQDSFYMDECFIPFFIPLNDLQILFLQELICKIDSFGKDCYTFDDVLNYLIQAYIQLCN